MKNPAIKRTRIAVRIIAMNAFILRSVNLRLTEAPMKAPARDPTVMLAEISSALADRSPRCALRPKLVEETSRLIRRFAAQIHPVLPALTELP
jgi:hypothetical protein